MHGTTVKKRTLCYDSIAYKYEKRLLKQDKGMGYCLINKNN
jgi:hypothetical protein